MAKSWSPLRIATVCTYRSATPGEGAGAPPPAASAHATKPQPPGCGSEHIHAGLRTRLVSMANARQTQALFAQSCALQWNGREVSRTVLELSDISRMSQNCRGLFSNVPLQKGVNRCWSIPGSSPIAWALPSASRTLAGKAQQLVSAHLPSFLPFMTLRTTEGNPCVLHGGPLPPAPGGVCMPARSWC